MCIVEQIIFDSMLGEIIIPLSATISSRKFNCIHKKRNAKLNIYCGKKNLKLQTSFVRNSHS